MFKHLYLWYIVIAARSLGLKHISLLIKGQPVDWNVLILLQFYSMAVRPPPLLLLLCLLFLLLLFLLLLLLCLLLLLFLLWCLGTFLGHDLAVAMVPRHFNSYKVRMISHIVCFQNVCGTDLVPCPVSIRRKLATPLVKAWKLAILTLAVWIVFIVCLRARACKRGQWKTVKQITCFWSFLLNSN